MNWILILSLVSAPNGNYTREFRTEAECVSAMRQFIKNNADNPLVAGLACARKEHV